MPLVLSVQDIQLKRESYFCKSVAFKDVLIIIQSFFASMIKKQHIYIDNLSIVWK